MFKQSVPQAVSPGNPWYDEIPTDRELSAMVDLYHHRSALYAAEGEHNLWARQMAGLLRWCGDQLVDYAMTRKQAVWERAGGAR